MTRGIAILRSLVRRLGNTFRRRSAEIAKQRRATSKENGRLCDELEKLSAEKEAIIEILLAEIHRLKGEQDKAKMEVKRANEDCASAEKRWKDKALQLSSTLVALTEQVARTEELEHSLEMINQLQPMSSQLQLKKGSGCKTVKTPPGIAPQCQQEVQVEDPSVLLQSIPQAPNPGQAQFTRWDDMPAFPVAVTDLFEPKKKPKKKKAKKTKKSPHKPSQSAVVQPQYVKTPIDGIYLML